MTKGKLEEDWVTYSGFQKLIMSVIPNPVTVTYRYDVYYDDNY